MLLPEDELIKGWVGGSAPLVSVICITFNHASYISEAIDGFLSQETKFPFEIIIHDDASTDGTLDIIRGYLARYPKIIKLIAQPENTYVKGAKPTFACLPLVSGKYVALCEGDDFWVDPRKLQLQAEMLDGNSAADMVFHSAFTQVRDDALSRKLAFRKRRGTGVISQKAVIAGDGGFVHTGSIMVRRQVFSRLPSWFLSEAPVGDYFIQIYAVQNGAALYIDKPMAVYRVGLPFSLTAGIKEWRTRLAFERRFVLSVEKAMVDFHDSHEAFSRVLLPHAIVCAELARRVKEDGAFQQALAFFRTYERYGTIADRAAMFFARIGAYRASKVFRNLRALRERVLGY